MTRGFFHYCIYGLWATFLPMHSYAIELPSIGDPFATQKKLAPYGVNLKPESCPNAPDPATSLSLNEVVIATLCHNPDARAAYLTLLSSADSYDGTVMSYLPNITASAAGGSTRSRVDNANASTARSSSASASAGMTLYDFGRREASLSIAERTLAAAGLSYDSTLQGFIATSLQQYFKLLTSQNAVEIEQLSYTLAKATLDAAETRYALGIVALSDVLQARTAFAQAELSVQTANNTLALDRASLAQLMGFAPLTEIHVSDLEDSSLIQAPFNNALVELIEKAKTRRTDLQTRKLQLENAEDSLKNTGRRGLPSISANASRSYDDWDIANNDTRHTDSIGVSVSIPIFTGFGNIFSERAERKNLEVQKLQLTQSERNVEQDVLNAWQNYTTSSKSFEISRSSLASARQLKEVSLGRYKEGLGSILDLLTAQNSYRSALQSHLSARYNLLTTRVDLIRAVGVLDLHSIELPAAPLPPLANIVHYRDPIFSKESSHETP